MWQVSLLHVEGGGWLPKNYKYPQWKRHWMPLFQLGEADNFFSSWVSLDISNQISLLLNFSSHLSFYSFVPGLCENWYVIDLFIHKIALNRLNIMIYNGVNSHKTGWPHTDANWCKHALTTNILGFNEWRFLCWRAIIQVYVQTHICLELFTCIVC